MDNDVHNPTRCPNCGHYLVCELSHMLHEFPGGIPDRIQRAMERQIGEDWKNHIAMLCKFFEGRP